jgi:hypothetical protein
MTTMTMNHATRSLFTSHGRRSLPRTLAAGLVVAAAIGGLALTGGCGAEPPTCECDAAITKLPTSDFPRGGTGTFAIIVDYFGHPLCKGGKVCIDDVLPAGLTYNSTPSAGWTCSGTTSVHCCYSGALPTTHTTLPVLTLVVNVSEKAPDVIENCATIEQGKRGDFSDADPDNNKSCVKTEVTTPCPPKALVLDLSTGIQDGAGALAISAVDDTWSIVAAPSPAMPGPAVVLQPNVGWQAPGSGAQWIGPKGGGSTGTAGDYTYETCFCLEEGFSPPQLDLTLRGDNNIKGVTLNGCQLLPTPGGVFSGTAAHVQGAKSECFQPGENCIDVTVHNQGGPTGLSVVGKVNAENGLCCE